MIQTANISLMMKPYLLFLLCCVSFSLFAQTGTERSSLPEFSLENIEFKSEGVTLSGTIYTPRQVYAAVVLVHGSGRETRMLAMATLLAKHGIAVLTYDKRGAGKSGGIYAGPEVGTNNIDSANLNLLALDASAASDALLAHLPPNHGLLGLIGFSQAGWTIPLAAQKNKNVNFMILFSGPVITTLEQLRFQFYTESKPNFWDTHTETEVREHIKSDADRYHFADTDPRDALSKLSIPGLWLFGGKDVQVPVRVSIERLELLNKKHGKQYEYQLFPELGHNTAFSTSQEPVNLAIKWIESNGFIKYPHQ